MGENRGKFEIAHNARECSHSLLGLCKQPLSAFTDDRRRARAFAPGAGSRPRLGRLSPDCACASAEGYAIDSKRTDARSWRNSAVSAETAPSASSRRRPDGAVYRRVFDVQGGAVEIYLRRKRLPPSSANGSSLAAPGRCAARATRAFLPADRRSYAGTLKGEAKARLATIPRPHRA